ncbi:MAG TPA: hypothetical protein VGD68_12705 [Streptosporangiaceae bacterium]
MATGALASALLAGAGSAQAAVNPAPAVSVAPATTYVNGELIVAYDLGNGSVWVVNESTGASFSAGGKLAAAPSIIATGASSALIFGRGSDNGLWETSISLSAASGRWSSLGGTITSKPGAASQGSSGYAVYARGRNGALWGRSHGPGGWGGWKSAGGSLLTGTGPSAAYLGGTYVLVTGANSEPYITEPGVSGFTAAGGETVTSPALAAVSWASGQALIGVVRGPDNQAYYHRFLSTSPGWHSFSGQFSSPLAFTGGPTAGESRADGLGSDGRLWTSSLSWSTYPPTVSAWALEG